jgi:hypothetical protein
MTFQQRQIEVRQDEIALENKTQVLLFDILNKMTPAQHSMLDGYAIDEDNHISTDENNVCVTQDLCLVISRFDDDLGITPIDDLSQVEQKDLIDFILENNLVD